MANGGTELERLARIEMALEYIRKGIDKSDKQWLKYDNYNIPNSLSKIDTLSENQKNINERLTKVEQHIKMVQWAGVVIIIPILGFIAKFLNVKIDADKIITLGIIYISEIIEIFV
tara:strand:- start:143 stop:490 length:348 start_codon:yes stop_codon:yes gene_type:complete